MEIEAKFRVPDAAVLRKLAEAASLGGLPLTEARLKDVSDTYVDTADWAIFNAGYSCRRREGDGGVLLTLKQLRVSEDAVHRREELEVTLPADVPPEEWPKDSPARALVLGIVHGASLVEMLKLRQTRTVRLVGPQDSPLAELSLDEVVVIGTDTPYFEAEVELKPSGTDKDLESLARSLREEWGLEPEPCSKFERAVATLGLVAEGAVAAAVETNPVEAADPLDSAEPAIPTGPTRPAEPAIPSEPVAQAASAELTAEAAFITQLPAAPAVSKKKVKVPRAKNAVRPLNADVESLEPDIESITYAAPDKPGIEVGDTMAEAAKKTLLFHLSRMTEHEAGTRAGEDAEELHDMRVSTRRMRAALRVFRDYLDPKAFRPFLKTMRETGGTLGTVRDLDVFRIKTQSYVDSLPEEARGGLDTLLDAWQGERERARETMLSFLDSGRYVRFRDGFQEFLRTPGAGEASRVAADGESLPTRVRDVLPAVLYERLATVRAFDEWIHVSDVPLVRYHQLRIASKGLRYTLEFFQEVLGANSKAVIDRTKLLQDHLGDMQDAIVTCDVLLGFLTTGQWGPPRAGRLVPRGMAAGSPGVAVYLAAKEMEIQALRATFPPVWEKIRGGEFSRPLAGLVADL